MPHLRLLHKLEVYGIRDKLLMWFKNFPVGRQQCVALNNILSIVTIVAYHRVLCWAPYFLLYLLMTFHTLLEVMTLNYLEQLAESSDDIQILQDDIHKLFE